MRFKWIFPSDQSECAVKLVRSLGIPPLVARILINRGVVSPEKASAFLYPRLRDLSDPFLLPGLEKAVEFLWEARKANQTILIFGDYDVDGISSTAILFLALRQLGWQVEYYLPNRLEDGYGLSLELAQRCFRHTKAKIWITVDCGSTSYQAIDWLYEHGVQVIVIDHHRAGKAPARAVAIINPCLLSNEATLFPWSHLCSGGLSFKFVHGLVKKGRALGIPEAYEYDIRSLLDLAALATVADQVPLVDENRILVARGLQLLNQSPRIGIKVLQDVASIIKEIRTYEISFMLAPRLNVAGRIENAHDALMLLLETDQEKAIQIANKLNYLNSQRQQLEKRVLSEASERIKKNFEFNDDYVIVEGADSWHLGVVGIVASRILQLYYRPTIILGGDNGLLRGSGRSIEGFDLAWALEECADLLVKYGGHAMAVGLTIKPQNLERLRFRLNEIARQTIKKDRFCPLLKIDTIAQLPELTVSVVKELERLGPFGPANPYPHICIRNLRIAKGPIRIGKTQQHLRFLVTDGNTTSEVICWDAKEIQIPNGIFDLVCIPEINEFGGHCSVRLKWIDWRASH